MSVSTDILVIYGFPADDISLKVPTPLGGKAPSLYDWLESNNYDTEALLHWGGAVERSAALNGVPDVPVPFIGVVRQSTTDLRRACVPAMKLDKDLIAFGAMDEAQAQDEMLLGLRSALGCTRDIAYYIVLSLT